MCYVILVNSPEAYLCSVLTNREYNAEIFNGRLMLDAKQRNGQAERTDRQAD